MKRPLAMAVLAAACTIAATATLGGPARATYGGATNGRIAFGMNVNGNTDVYTVLPNGEDLRRLTTDPGFDACAAYSADGRRIAYCSGQGGGPVQVWTMRQNGTDKQQVTHMSGAAIFPDYSPDGSEIVFTAQPAGATARNIYVVRSDGGTPQQLTTAGNNVYPAFSPDGRRIVFTSNRTGTSQVYVMNADGSGQTQLTFDSQPKDQVPDWSPDGSRIAYLADTHGIPDVSPSWGDIWVMNADGSDQHRITDGASWYGTAWSPDGTRIVTLDFPSRTIYTVDATHGGDVTAVHPGPGIQFVPGWQPRGTGSDDDNALTLVRTTIVSASVTADAAIGPAQAALRPASARASRGAALVTTTIRVTTFNSSFHLSAKTAPRGVVIFKVTNRAIFGHDFSIDGHTTRVLKKGQSTTLRVTFLKPGHYVYKDTVDHHVRWGDVGGFTIT